MSRKRFLSTIKLQRGDVIIINNYKTAHGRKKFKIDQSYKRSILRAWVN